MAGADIETLDKGGYQGMKFPLEHYLTLEGSARTRFKQAHNLLIMSPYSIKKDNPHHIETVTREDETLIHHGKRKQYGGLDHAEGLPAPDTWEESERRMKL